ncbi:TetR/AcrR family transcriptional regulator [Spiractinospora alimapuensis]|uniref:TetR/AcrR family transcriptional regulator n=1 Tax=Spiractinospora alimapuensis TaxID=2820884 RepID=UPI001F264DC1|nr:TetR/AcrR family transcriptional regulator [Spiractinospora alimapuensis]QVQ50751.1 TetR/AcrR family transcriptional regulator [Spiractinospora alimapuensis]
MTPTTPRTRAEQRERTRQVLIRDSRRLFAAHGYAAVGLSEIVRSAGVTKGALYHHFDAKVDLFRAVLSEVQTEVGDTVASTADAQSDPWEQLVAGCQAFLEATSEPGVQRIMLVDGPAVLGWAEWRALDEATSARHLAEALTSLMEAGLITEQPVTPLTRLLSGAMNEAALWLATSTDPADLPATQAALRRILEAFRAK